MNDKEASEMLNLVARLQRISDATMLLVLGMTFAVLLYAIAEMVMMAYFPGLIQ